MELVVEAMVEPVVNPVLEPVVEPVVELAFYDATCCGNLLFSHSLSQ